MREIYGGIWGMIVISHSEEETVALGQKTGLRIARPVTIALRGGLGAGKTAFVRGLAAGLGVDDGVSSPTFALVHEHKGRLPLFHFDLYRLRGEDEWYDIGFDDYLNRGGVCVVEWSERVPDFWPPDTVLITLSEYPECPDWRRISCDLDCFGF
jgi:tRNA threonylcarbamoyladenosine biosynthesis protein TsaE